MISLFVHDDANDDLEALWDTEPEAAARIVVLLEELKGDPDLLDRLTQNFYGVRGHSQFNVRKWEEHWNKGRDLWRLKIWDLEDKGLKYRIIYAFIPITKHHHILAIAPRDFDYETSHPISQRLLSAYEEL